MSFLNYFFGKNPKDLFLGFHPEGAEWRVVTWNMDLKTPTDRQWSVEVQKPESEVIIWKKSQVSEVSFFKKQQLLSSRRITEKNERLSDLMNLAIHSTIKEGIEAHFGFMTSPVSGVTTADYQTEAKALLWIQASFETLNRALTRVAQDTSLVLTASVFSGIVPETNQRVFRLLIFSLDIFYYMKEDDSLHILIFDDKNLGHGGAKTPTFQQIIKVTKPQFYDEIVKLVHRLANVGEIH